jgi:hypothetical protein
MNVVQLDPEQQKEMRKGLDKGRNIFNKSKQRMTLLSKDQNVD